MNMSKLLPVAIVIVLGLVIFVVWPKDGTAPPETAGNPSTPSLAGAGLAAHPGGRTGTEENPPTPQPRPATPSPAVRPAPAPTPPPPAASSDVITAARALIARADALLQADKPLEARGLLHQAFTEGLPEAEQGGIRSRIDTINQKLLFGSTIASGDVGCQAYVLKRGDLLQRIARKFDVDWRLLKRINGISNERLIRAGRRIKVVKGPFHVIVRKAAFRLEVYQGARFVCQFAVGLGVDNGTPVGRFTVSDKLENPPWRNPRTGKLIKADDPTNPLGEYWIGLAGSEPATANLDGYGIHGTIEPRTIGTQASMGCVRMRAADVERLFSLLIVGKSTVTITP